MNKTGLLQKTAEKLLLLLSDSKPSKAKKEEVERLHTEIQFLRRVRDRYAQQ